MQQAQSPLKKGQVAVQPQQPQQQGGGQDNFDASILQNLEQHLNQLDPRQKNFLASSLQHYANIVIPVLGIVCGQEVMDYFLNIYKQHFAKGAGQQPNQQQQQNSAPNPQGQQPNQAVQPQPQQAPAQQPPAQQPQPQQ